MNVLRNQEHKNRISVFGGSFNPPHVAHLRAALWVLQQDLSDRVWLQPTYRHAFDKPLVDFEHRVRMCRLLAEEHAETISVSECEKTIPGVSYTVDILTALRNRFPEYIFSLILGSDLHGQKHLWKSFDQIEATTRIHWIGRRGYDDEAYDFVLPDISSSTIRKRIRSNQPVTEMLTPGVLRYIREHQLYRDEPPSFG